MSSPDEAMGERAALELGAAARLLDAMGMDDDAVLVVHVGSAYGEPLAARERFVRRYEQLPARARARLALENDDRHFDLADTLWVHRRTGIRLVFDVLHHRVLDSQGRPMTDALAAALATWPASCKPKIHFSSPRTAIRQVMRNGERQLQMPLPNQHSDFIHPFEFIDFLREATAARSAAVRHHVGGKGQGVGVVAVARADRPLCAESGGSRGLRSVPRHLCRSWCRAGIPTCRSPFPQQNGMASVRQVGIPALRFYMTLIVDHCGQV